MCRYRNPSRQADVMSVWMLDLLTWCWSKPTMPNFGIDCHHNRINDQYMLNNVVGEYILFLTLQSFQSSISFNLFSNVSIFAPIFGGLFVWFISPCSIHIHWFKCFKFVSRLLFPKIAWCGKEFYWPKKRQPRWKAPKNWVRWTHCSGNKPWRRALLNKGNEVIWLCRPTVNAPCSRVCICSIFVICFICFICFICIWLIDLYCNLLWYCSSLYFMFLPIPLILFMDTTDGHTATLKPLLRMSQQPEGKHKKNDILQLMPQGNADDWEATGDLKHFKQNLIQLMGLTQENSTGTASSGGRGNKDRGRKETRWVDIYNIVIVGWCHFFLKILLTLVIFWHLFFFLQNNF